MHELSDSIRALLHWIFELQGWWLCNGSIKLSHKQKAFIILSIQPVNKAIFLSWSSGIFFVSFLIDKMKEKSKHIEYSSLWPLQSQFSFSVTPLSLNRAPNSNFISKVLSQIYLKLFISFYLSHFISNGTNGRNWRRGRFWMNKRVSSFFWSRRSQVNVGIGTCGSGDDCGKAKINDLKF